MYRKLIKPILFAMNIERAHSTVLFLLRMIGKIPGGRALLRAIYRTEHPSLEREVFGLRFPNPIGLAAGFDRNGEAFRELSALGFGFVEIGTVTPQPQAGNPRPRIFRLPADRAIINRSGLNNKGLYKAIAQLRHRHDRLIIGGNIGKNTLTQPSQVAADYLKMFRNLYQYVDYFSINVCCDNCADGSVSHNKAHLMNILQPLFDFSPRPEPVPADPAENIARPAGPAYRRSDRPDAFYAAGRHRGRERHFLAQRSRNR